MSIDRWYILSMSIKKGTYLIKKGTYLIKKGTYLIKKGTYLVRQTLVPSSFVASLKNVIRILKSL